MSIRSTASGLVPLLTATILAATLTGCGGASQEDAGASTSSKSSPAAPIEAEEEPQVSPPRIERTKDNGKPATTDTLQLMTGEDRWSITPDVGIDGALGLELGRRADAFLRDHVLRRDRWTGKWNIKAGELDAYREKVTPALADKVESALGTLEEDIAKYGADFDKWPKKAAKVNQKRVGTFGYLLFNTDATKGGKGDYLYRVTQRQIFRGNAEWGWKGDLVGAPITFMYVDGLRKNGTGQSKRFSIHQAWKKVKGEWIVLDAGYQTR